MGRLVIALAFVAWGTNVEAQWLAQQGGSTARLRGLSVVDAEVAWASGAGGTVLRTTDGGKTWSTLHVPDTEALDFRDVEAIDARTAYLLSIGEGGLSRIYKTEDGGANWELRYRNTTPDGFLDALAFWDADHGIALGDPLDGRFEILATDDGGRTWRPIAPKGMPPALPGEGAFAASGTCLVTGEGGLAWFGTGGAEAARVFRSTDHGRTWTVRETPVVAGSPSSGIFSLAFDAEGRGVAVGGDYKVPARAGNLVALTRDGGRTWTKPEGHGPAGFRSAVAFIPGRDGLAVLAVGPTGADLSIDGGERWSPLGTDGFHSLAVAGPAAGWAVGEGGTVARFVGEPSSPR